MRSSAQATEHPVDPRCAEAFLARSEEIIGIIGRFTEESSEAT
jgi:hypothetical protein